jgi:hypothetical protein
VVASDVTFIYIGLYNSTFSIPQNFFKTRKRVLIGSKLLALRRAEAEARAGAEGVEREASIIARQMVSVRPVGIKMGGFRQLERQSTPNFVMFVLFNTGRLLVTLKGRFLVGL